MLSLRNGEIELTEEEVQTAYFCWKSFIDTQRVKDLISNKYPKHLTSLLEKVDEIRSEVIYSSEMDVLKKAQEEMFDVLAKQSLSKYYIRATVEQHK